MICCLTIYVTFISPRLHLLSGDFDIAKASVISFGHRKGAIPVPVVNIPLKNRSYNWWGYEVLMGSSCGCPCWKRPMPRCEETDTDTGGGDLIDRSGKTYGDLTHKRTI